MGTGLVAPRYEGGLGGRDPGERRDGIGRALEPRGIGLGADDYEVVVHHVPALGAVAGLHERVLEGAGVDEEHVGVGVFAQLDGCAGSDRDDVHGVAGILGKVGQQVGEQA